MHRVHQPGSSGSVQSSQLELIVDGAVKNGFSACAGGPFGTLTCDSAHTVLVRYRSGEISGAVDEIGSNAQSTCEQGLCEEAIVAAGSLGTVRATMTASIAEGSTQPGEIKG